MVGLVLVSHSLALAEAVKELVLTMTGPDLPIALAAGTGEGRKELGTDAMEILSAIRQMDSGQGVVVLMDMGSAILSAETAHDFLEEAQKPGVVLCSAPFVEGAVAVGVSIKMGNDIHRVLEEAAGVARSKDRHLQNEQRTSHPDSSNTPLEKEAAAGVFVRVSVVNPAGLHARPAAKLLQMAARFQSEIFLENPGRNKGPILANSLISLMTLEAREKDELKIRAVGADQDDALAALKRWVEEGMGDSIAAVERKTAGFVSVSPEHVQSVAANLGPIPISDGVAAGTLYRLQRTTEEPPEIQADDAKTEQEKMRQALQKCEERLARRIAELSRKADQEQAGIFEAQSLLLKDPVLLEKAAGLMVDKKLSAVRAWWVAVREAIASYHRLENEILRERAADLADIGRMVLSELGHASGSIPNLPEPGILLVDDLTPGEVSRLDPERVLGVICLLGSRTSHGSILLRSRGIPAVGQAFHFQPPLDSIEFPTSAAMDGGTGKIYLQPDPEILEKIQTERKHRKESRKRALAESGQPALTRRGERFDVLANVGKIEDAESAVKNGADGIGLLRTEFMFLERTNAPGEDEQVELLRAITAPLRGKTIVVRTLDAGGDKELPYLHRPQETNPYLGVRAIRLCLRDQALFQTQLRAILRAANDCPMRIMFPMIATVEELHLAKAELKRAHENLLGENIAHCWPIPTGMMMEVPSTAILAATFVPHLDFVSIGTNDLTQYTLAADRNHSELAELQDPTDPAVLALIRNVVSACRDRGIEVSVCGEAAADPKAARIFAEIGIRHLSMSSRIIPSMKEEIRSWEN